MPKPDEVPCRCCGVMVELHDDAWELAMSFSKILLARGESTIKNDEMAACVTCRGEMNREHAEAWEQINTEAQAILARVRQGYTPTGDERDFLYANGFHEAYDRAKEVLDDQTRH